MKFATKLTLLFSALFLILCVFITQFVTSSSSDILEATFSSQMEARALKKMVNIDKVLYERSQDIKMMAGEVLFESKNPSPKLITERLNELLNNSDYYTSLSFFEMSRKRIADTMGRDVGKIHTPGEFWPEIESGKDAVIGMYLSESLHMPVFHIARVVKDDAGARKGVLVGRIATHVLNEIMKSPPFPQPFDAMLYEENLTVDLVDKNGLIVYSNYNELNILKKDSKYWKYIKDDAGSGTAHKGYRLQLPGMEEEIVTFGREQGYGDYKGNQWILIIHVPSRVVFAPAIDLRNRLIIYMAAIGACSLLLILLILLFARTISKPLKKLSIAAKEIGSGNLDARVEIESNDEVAELAKNLNAMVGNLSSSRQALHRSEESHRKLFENAGDYIYSHDLGGIFTSINRALCERIGYRPEELVGFSISKIVHPASLEKARAMTEAKLKGESFYSRYEIKIIARNGEIIPTELNSWLIIENGRPAGVQGIGRDIGARKTAELALRTAKDRAEAATLLKDKFVTLVSHDLKGPLSVMLGFLKLLKKDMEAARVEEKFLLASALSSGEKMVALINDILNVSKLRSGKILPKLVFTDACFLTAKVMSVLAAQAEQKGITLVNRLPQKARIYADPELLGQVFQNLVSNAIKFCDSGGMVTIFMPEDEPSTLAVSDTGVGIDPERIENLFKYDETTSTNGTAGEVGSGFGLPLSNDIVVAHGGSLTVESVPGKGSTFLVQLPFVRPRILIVDDDPLTRKLIWKYLHGLNLEFIEAADGKEALDIVEKWAPHLIMTDLNMPVMDGFALLEHLKRNSMTKHLPVIAITSESGLESRERAMGLGANDFIGKDTDINEFILRVTKFLFTPNSLN